MFVIYYGIILLKLIYVWNYGKYFEIVFIFKCIGKFFFFDKMILVVNDRWIMYEINKFKRNNFVN